MTNICKRQRSRLYIYTKRKNCKTFIYKNPDTLQKARQFALRFIWKIQTLNVTQFFMKILKLAFAYKKHDTLRNVTFLYTKIQKLRKNKDNLRYVFIYKNLTLSVTQFYGILEIGGGGGGVYTKKIQFELYFYMQKTMHLLLRFI